MSDGGSKTHMNGKRFMAGLFLFFLTFAIILFYSLYSDRWFDVFINGGFKELYGK